MNGFSLAHLILVLSLHYLVKCKSCSLAIYKNELILCSACVGSENYGDYKIIDNLLRIKHL